MQEESLDEFVCRKGHGFLVIVVAIVSPVEFHMTAFDVDDPMVGDSDPMRVAADVVHHLLWSGEGRLGVNDPFHISHRIEITAESLRISQCREGREEPQVAGVEGILQILQEQSAEQAGQHPHGQEEAWAAGDPPSTIGRDSAARNDTMQMGMEKQVLSPTMEYGKEADFRSQMFGIGGDGGQSLGGGSKQDAVNDLFVLVSDRSDLIGDSEDDMKVVDRENFGCSPLDPLCTRERLALGTMAVAAAAITRPFVIAAVTTFKMTAESCGATHLDRGHDTPLGRRYRPVMLLTIGFAVAAEDVRHFQLRAIHRARWLEVLGWCGLDLYRNRTRQEVQRARCRTDFAGRNAEIFCCRRQAAMAE